MTSLPRICLKLTTCVVIVYVCVLLALMYYQRQMLYFPAQMEKTATAASYGLHGVRDLSLTTSDGETIAAWYQPAAPDKDFYLIFHGNGGDLGTMAGLLRDMAVDSAGFLAIDYRGYGHSSGVPTERGLMRDGEAAYAEARRLGYPQERIIIVGESLGTGVAIALASAHPPRALVLDSAFSSTADIAASRYWMFPVHLVMLDQYDSQELIRTVVAPKLFIHGGHDVTVDVSYGRKLYDDAIQPKTFIFMPDGGHLTLWRPDVLAKMRTWLAAIPKAY